MSVGELQCGFSSISSTIIFQTMGESWSGAGLEWDHPKIERDSGL